MHVLIWKDVSSFLIHCWACFDCGFTYIFVYHKLQRQSLWRKIPQRFLGGRNTAFSMLYLDKRGRYYGRFVCITINDVLCRMDLMCVLSIDVDSTIDHI